MLMREIFVRFDEANRCRVTGVLERFLIAPAEETIGAEDLAYGEVGHVRGHDLGNEAREFARGRVVLRADQVHALKRRACRQRLAEDANDVRFAEAVAAGRVADDVVVEYRQNRRVQGRLFAREVVGTPQPELFTVETRKDNRSAKVRGRHHAGRFQHRRNPGAVVVGAGRDTGAVGAVPVAVVEVTRHDVRAAGFVAAQRRDDARLEDGTRRLIGFRLDVRVESDAQPSARRRSDRLELRRDPVARAKDAVRGRRGRLRKIVARPEGNQTVVGRLQTLGVDRTHHRGDTRIGDDRSERVVRGGRS